MLLYGPQYKYTKELIIAIIPGKSNRSGPAEKLAENFGGKLFRFYGLNRNPGSNV